MPCSLQPVDHVQLIPVSHSLTDAAHPHNPLSHTELLLPEQDDLLVRDFYTSRAFVYVLVTSVYAMCVCVCVCADVCTACC